MNFYFKIIGLKRKNLAFTIAEMLVTISVITILTIIIMTYSRGGESLTNLVRESERLVYYLKLAQSSAMLILQEKGDTKICGWGIHFDNYNDQYILFKDICPGNKSYDDNMGEMAEIIKPLNGIILSSSSVSNIVFVPPNPDVYFDGNSGATDKIITLCLIDKSKCINVTITNTGLIYKEI
jgi:hypothetical protein